MSTCSWQLKTWDFGHNILHICFLIIFSSPLIVFENLKGGFCQFRNVLCRDGKNLDPALQMVVDPALQMLIVYVPQCISKKCFFPSPLQHNPSSQCKKTSKSLSEKRVCINFSDANRKTDTQFHLDPLASITWINLKLPSSPVSLFISMSLPKTSLHSAFWQSSTVISLLVYLWWRPAYIAAPLHKSLSGRSLQYHTCHSQ